MNNLLKVLALAIGFLVMTIIPVACDKDEDPVSKQDFSIVGKVFVNSYFNDADESHEAGTEILEFKTDGSVVKYSLFCLLAAPKNRTHSMVRSRLIKPTAAICGTMPCRPYSGKRFVGQPD